jgi:hypothetical protein
MSTRYDHPNAIVRREKSSRVTGAASGSLKKLLFFQKAKVQKVHAIVEVAGTNDAAVMVLKNGTTAIGTMTFGTQAIGSVVHSAALNSSVGASGYLDVDGATNSATLVVDMVVEYEVEPDAVQS